MRQTPVDDYLEEISTELPEELYGNLSDAIYETVCEFDEGVAQLRAENAKLRELCEDMHAALQAFCDAQDVHGDNCPLWVERTDDCELRGIERHMRELRIEVDG